MTFLRTYGPLLASLAGAVALVVAASAVTSPTETKSIYGSPGGAVFEFIEKYNDWSDKGYQVRVDGPCVSACTYVVDLIDNDKLCATEDAHFLFHGVYNGGVFNRSAVSLIHPIVYSKETLALLASKGFDGTKDVDREQYPSGFIELTANELGIRPC